jgi:TldD protein
MTSSRREFLRRTKLAVGVVALPSWVFEAEAAEAAAVDKNKLADSALSTAKKLGATYADIRINRTRLESVTTREQQVQNVSRSQSFGFGVRVLVKGAWGFAASGNVTPEEVQRITRQAVEVAQANSAYQRKPVQLVSTPMVLTSWKSSFEKDPFEVPVEDKVGFLLKLNEVAMATKGVSFVNSSLSFHYCPNVS